MIQINDKEWHYIGIYCNEGISNIAIGDSIEKVEQSFNIFLIKNNEEKINLTEERFRTKKCK